LRFGRKLIEKAESLATFPDRGRVIPKFADLDLREVVLGSYRIAYRIRRTPALEIEIARIWHGARSEENLTL
jgi:toxin ParE1/3/4